YYAVSSGNGVVTWLALIVGAFIGPVVYVLYLAECDVLGQRLWRLVVTFVLGGVLGSAAAIGLEAWIGPRGDTMDLGGALLIGLIEATAKLLGVVWLLWQRPARFEMDGIILGAAAGMGFAALENVGYGLLGHNLTQMFAIVSWRAVISPFGHGTWTA